MERITKQMLTDRLEFTNKYITEKGNENILHLEFFNGYTHLYTKTGEKITAGNNRQIFDTLYTICQAFWYLQK